MIDIDPYLGYIIIYEHYVGKIFISASYELPTGLSAFIKPVSQLRAANAATIRIPAA